jgi:hypothetical protein
MREDSDNTYDALKGALDKLVKRDVTLSSFGMSGADFIEQAHEEILQRVQAIASERLENND